MKMKTQIKIYLQVVRVLFFFSSFCCDFFSSSPLCDILYSRWQKTEADIQHTVYWFEERGNEITLWDWCLCLYMTFTAPHFISHSASLSPFCLLLPLPSIIPCRSEREKGAGERKKNLIALTNEVSWDRQPTQGRMFHGDSERETEQKWACETLVAPLHLHFTTATCLSAATQEGFCSFNAAQPF